MSLFSSLLSAASGLLRNQIAGLLPARNPQNNLLNEKRRWRFTLGVHSISALRDYTAGYGDANNQIGDGNSLYNALPTEGHTRLLRVSCVHLERSRHYICELVPVVIDSPKIPYISISYTWGDTAPVRQIHIGSHSVGISRSVAAVLDSLFDDGDMMHLWIDAICINQSDMEEKAGQVRLMRDIYAHAYAVVVSLGEPTVQTDSGMDLIYPLEQELRHLEQGLPANESFWRDNPATGPGWTGLGEVLRRPWFGRIWVIQEAAVGPAPLILCGQRAVDWDTLFYVVAVLGRHGLIEVVRGDANRSLDEPPPLEPLGLNNLVVMHEARCVQQNGEQEPFQEALMGMYHFGATDERDKVFALLGLAERTDDPELMPDYNSSVADIYKRTAHHLLLRDPDIHILHKAGIGFHRQLRNLPSWVPDWTSDAIASFGSVVRTALYRACGDTVSAARPGDLVDSITLDGITVDTIVELSLPRPRAPLGGGKEDLARYCVEDRQWLEDVKRLVARLLASAQAQELNSHVRDRTVTEWKEALWRTIIGDTVFFPKGKAPAEYGQKFEYWCRIIESEREPQLSSTEGAAAAEYNRMCTGFTERRRTFRTRTGYIGLTAAGAAPGDVVCIFLGGVTPFVIRSRGNGRYDLVGEAYVHDIMQGEAMSMSDVESFVLL